MGLQPLKKWKVVDGGGESEASGVHFGMVGRST
jgi:hypothetical protein